ncbi:bifunctional phosphopantothenoylcysteine decarboxylase/phosphopantothenate--cysteine ligase CoaBC [Natronobacterium gregoryi]|uniref:Coenzyme A biosynthesis bifunctional protein CoaBC n=2 Tax=Natronobacterium gregoryi TaxID=44930 RepID=L0AG61_NATGS|nr:bifunctional phosphopantothenoylcysteine decarboxylase/phosphopantothenate--cysteine ligase CoaBC [Natronobacterium gregoryi]AFZ72055.1 phosphopantothenoylcysteine decarboxylase/phosphopantothenate--cysteine ligase [Natronobacterium gregoryi SP2]ELY62773.1 phosphopantothenoylcysteine decarboxylase/phosphopantothenate/cysteine ligase [Natronobacterium gregoryi SP2]PLK20903.1 bifunctional phosphopantothenoylcysteine decarboxylase/phosphopantothenate--cysteine ligase CoaBC [Natronobacterium greg
MLEGVNVALGVTGSIAAVKTVELVHELRRRGAEVRGVMTDSARGIVHPWTVEFATDNDVVTEITGEVQHVDLCGYDGWADVFLIAPATANTVGKIAAAIDDTPVTTCATTALGTDVPVVIVPAMHKPMYDHPGVLEAIDAVDEWGVEFVDPRIEEGKAKIASEEAIVCAIARAAGPAPLEGERVVVTSGATAESVDPVRVLTNRSSGKMGRAVARACYVRGADVTLVHGVVGPRPLSSDSGAGDVPYAAVREVETAAEMIETTREACVGADTLVSAAAIGDYTLESRVEKIRSGQDVTLELESTAKLIDEIRADRPELPIVGFKTETAGDESTMIAQARETLGRADLAFVVANDASVMGADETRALLVHAEDAARFEGTKAGLGGEIADSIAAILSVE